MAKTVVNLSDQMALFVQKTNLISTHVGDLVTLTTTHDSDLVGAINELDSSQGTIASLSTTDKSSLVAAVNEVKGEITTVSSGFSGFLRSNINDVVTAGSIRFDDAVPLVIGSDSDFTITHSGGTTTAAGAITFSGAITGALTGNASTASQLQTARDIALTGDVTGSVSFDGSGNVNLATTLTANNIVSADFASSVTLNIINSSGTTVKTLRGPGS
jgi:hypothetical protein